MDEAQIPLFCDSLADAIRAVVLALGGNKRVGNLLWPSLPADEAGRKLAHCLNPDKREKLSPEDFMLILREARKVNCHAGFAYIAHECGYADPVPLEPDDERAALQREFVETGKTLRSLLARMERAGLHIA